jgi:hypothetical protein
LGQIADGQRRRGAVDRALVGDFEAGENPQERRLPDPIGTDDAHASARTEDEGDVGQNWVGAVDDGDVGGSEGA